MALVSRLEDLSVNFQTFLKGSPSLNNLYINPSKQISPKFQRTQIDGKRSSHSKNHLTHCFIILKHQTISNLQILKLTIIPKIDGVTNKPETKTSIKPQKPRQQSLHKHKNTFH